MGIIFILMKFAFMLFNWREWWCTRRINLADYLSVFDEMLEVASDNECTNAHTDNQGAGRLLLLTFSK